MPSKERVLSPGGGEMDEEGDIPEIELKSFSDLTRCGRKGLAPVFLTWEMEWWRDLQPKQGAEVNGAGRCWIEA